MTTRFCRILCLLLAAALVLAGCKKVITPMPQASVVPPAENSESNSPTSEIHIDPTKIKVGLVTNAGGVNEQAFNQQVWNGIQKAGADMGFQVQIAESIQPEDYEKNIDLLASENFQVIVTTGSAMADATALKAKQYPDIQFAILDHDYSGDYPSNLTSLMFSEEQAGFLAGVLAGGMSKSGFVCSISSIRTSRSDRYVMSYHAGAAWQNTNNKIMNNYINISTAVDNVPTFDDSTQGKDTAEHLFAEGCDVVFAVGGDAVSGVFQAAKDNNLPSIGADNDQYSLFSNVQSAILTSTLKNGDVVIYNYLKTIADGSHQKGVTTATLQDGGVGLAPYHDWQGQIPAELLNQIQTAANGLMDGSIH